MSDSVTPPTTTPAPSASAAAAPATSAPRKSFNDTYDDMVKNIEGDAAKTPAPTAPTSSTPAAAAAQAKRLLKLKLLDDKEEDFDIDEHYADEAKRAKLVADLQLGRSHSHLLSKAERAAHAKAIEDAKASWNKFLQRKGFDIVEDKNDEDGWNVVQRGKSAASTDPLDVLAVEDADLKKKINESQVVDPTWLSRRLDIAEERTKLLAGRTKSEAVSDFEKRQSDAARASERQENSRKADEFLLGDIDKAIAARTKSFEGMSDAKKARLREAAKSAGKQAFSKAGNVPPAQAWEAVLNAARAAVKEEADDADALRAHALRGLPPVKEPPTSAPLLGGAPSGPSSKAKSFDEEYDRLVKNIQ